jgi:mannose-6-phosphate isomerase
MEPIIFQPYLRPMVWGGRRLGELFNKPLPAEGTFGESWEISAHPHHVSRVDEGAFRGESITNLCAAHSRALFGAQVPAGGRFPLLIKLLDCRDLLSIQVHPNDEQARRLAGEQFGKTEAWVVLDVQPGGRIYAGLKPGVTRAVLERHLEDGTVDLCLHAFTPAPGDCVFLPAGTVHAVGGGVVLAEVQQSSDATFRLYDWNRLGSDGKPRPLHVGESLESIDWGAGPVSPVAGRPISGLPEGIQGERLIHCSYFAIDRYTIGGPLVLPEFGRLSIWLVAAGATVLEGEGGPYRRAFRRGETVLVPAAAGRLSWRPLDASHPAVLLAVGLP